MHIDKDIIPYLKGKTMYLARRLGDQPVQIFETVQYLDKKERIWDVKESFDHPAGRAALGFSPDNAMTLVTWGPFIHKDIA